MKKPNLNTAMRGERLLRSSLVFNVLLASLASLFLLLPTGTIAASITSARDVLSRSQNSTLSNHEIKFVTPTGVESSTDTMTFTFESNYALGSFNVNNIDLAEGSTSNCTSATFTDKTLAGSASSGTWGVAQASQTITFTPPTDAASGEIDAGRCVLIEIGSNATNQAAGATIITNPTTNGDFTVTIGGSFGDSGVIATNIVADDSIDVTAAVATSIACTVDNTSTAFGTFTVATVTTAASTITWTVSTNAANGYNLTVRDVGNGSTAGLYSAGAAYNIASASADLGAVSSGYGLQGTKTDGDAGSASSSIQPPYNVGTTNVGALSIASPDAPLASAAGPVANATVTSTLKAKVSGLVPAGSYIDTLTYICTGIY